MSKFFLNKATIIISRYACGDVVRTNRISLILSQLFDICVESSWYKYCQRELLFVMLSWIVTISKARTYENDAHAAKTSPAALSILVIHHLQFEITYSKPYIYLFIFFFEILTIISMKLFTKALKFWFGGQ